MRARFARLAGAGVIALCVIAPETALSADSIPLPEPLTLAAALAQADAMHPELARQQALLDRAGAHQREIEARGAAHLSLEANLRAVEPSYKATDLSSNDSSLRLRLRKRLYDFGRSDALASAADADRLGREWDYLDARQQRRLEIMSRFFDVLLADLQYMRDNEVMTMTFLRWDKARQRNELGQLSDIEVLELESLFQQERGNVAQTRNQQRAARARLANSLNRPGQLSSDLVAPTLPVLERVGGELEELTEAALADNPRLKALRARVEGAGQQLKGARAGDGPVIHGEIEAAAYNKVTGTRDPLSAGLVFELPLSSGGAVEAEVARNRALLAERRAELALAEMEVRQAVLDLWLELDALRVRREEMIALGGYRELYLDRSRARYELEIQSDLGDAQARLVDYKLRKAEIEFATSLAWARLDALTGRLIDPVATGMHEEQR
ncbi:MAG: hypothetical protein B0D96_03005 [Candidatus Sedimenticola endophacoides]|nr:MAG: hypothetical protein B0D94_08745 [Candidatus Sedimenticola endophacoides]OQX37004.1 MAG: hypothetical protein B0D96_03005 [Candidatus Sedimenticola endophacoides]